MCGPGPGKNAREGVLATPATAVARHCRVRDWLQLQAAGANGVKAVDRLMIHAFIAGPAEKFEVLPCAEWELQHPSERTHPVLGCLVERQEDRGLRAAQRSSK